VLVLLLLIATPAVREPSRQPRSWHAARIVGIAAATIPILLAGASLLHVLPGELYWLVAGVLAVLIVGTGNAWVNAHRSRSRPALPAGGRHLTPGLDRDAAWMAGPADLTCEPGRRF
jgi:uncharacterized membrane protein YdfJ with MMPL/SSD domain